MAMTVSQLRTFLAVEKAGSIKGAAAELVVTQPSVSGAVAALEREIGVKLFERRGRGISPTAAGISFMPFASRVLALLEDGRAAAVEVADPEWRDLRVAAVTTAGEYLIPAVLSNYLKRDNRCRRRYQRDTREAHRLP